VYSAEYEFKHAISITDKRHIFYTPNISSVSVSEFPEPFSSDLMNFRGDANILPHTFFNKQFPPKENISLSVEITCIIIDSQTNRFHIRPRKHLFSFFETVLHFQSIQPADSLRLEKKPLLSLAVPIKTDLGWTLMRLHLFPIVSLPPYWPYMLV
jgi:hypothetical protein